MEEQFSDSDYNEEDGEEQNLNFFIQKARN